ncbi:ABC transporter substrate-binding protein [Phytoactinopolyspora limicola]|uniref:ABC transporter substrate-binding protein n=1 Tax=Phytoactinopolyspora limicola TaxID=2715536 RepID=UPI00140D7C53|nr:ABC transporter substrate-binding protein [Phytoactinopolyspora limicola]
MKAQRSGIVRSRGKVFAVVLATALIAACSGSGADDGPDTDGVEPSADADSDASPGTDGATDREVGDRMLTFALYDEPPTLDPAVATDGEAGKVIQNVYDQLVSVGSDGYEISPAVAESWEVSPDGLTYTFFLRDGVTFHDGSPLTAEAVKFSLERVAGVGQGAATLIKDWLDPENDVEVVDDHTVRMQLRTPYAGFLQIMGYFSAGSIVNPAVVEEHGTDDDPWAEAYLDSHVAGSGPFEMVAWERKQYVQLERYDEYWRGPARLATLVFQAGTEASSQQLAVQRGDVDIVAQLPADMLATVDDSPDVDVLVFPAADQTYWVFNNDAEPFDDPRVRQALSYAVDYDGILTSIVGDSGTRMMGPMPAGFVQFNPDVTIYERDVDRARQLLTEAGYPDGFTVTTDYVDVANLKQIAQVLQANLADVGVTLELRQVPFSQFLEDVASGESVMYPWVTNPATADPRAVLWTKFSDQSGNGPDGNFTRYHNAEVDQLLAEAQSTADEDLATANYQRVQELVAADAPWIFLYDTVHRPAVRTSVSGFELPVVGQPSFWDVDVSE